ncbi:hypothetical protein CEXT_73191 [Caerostris extrusa]|uniref:Uncharacterized protein n=1 Tax=Caerostris extrusa TaxID=172846 RepID=A0AAV4XK60_CAEEX|nr:hypothetical protein CEXT_73191 [Caerostris extrusa]
MGKQFHCKNIDERKRNVFSFKQYRDKATALRPNCVLLFEEDFKGGEKEVLARSPKRHDSEYPMFTEQRRKLFLSWPYFDMAGTK